MKKIKLSLKGNLKILKTRKDSKRRIIAGYASIAVMDSDEQIIPIEVLSKGMQSLLADPHYANVMLVHKNIQIGRIIEKFGKNITGVDETGLFIVCEIRQDIKTADEIWESIIDKKLNGFSIGCEVLLSHQECDSDKCVTVLDEINIFEVSVCSQPINKGSGFIILSKSKYDAYKSKDVCDSSKNKEENLMTDEKSEETVIEEIQDPEVKAEETVEEVTEEKAEEIELSVEERIETLERSINSILGTLENMAKVEEEEVEEEKEEEEDMKKKSDPEPVEVEPETKSEPEPVEDKSDSIQETLGAILKAITELQNDKSKEEAIGELKVALKASNDAVASLEKRVEILTKSEEPPEEVEQKTVKDTSKEKELEVDNPIVCFNGVITSREFSR